MRRAERLFHLVRLIRGRRLNIAAFLAQRLDVSERTVYPDVAELMAQGVPIDREAGVSYRMRAGFDLPPLMFTQDEARALVAAVRLAQLRLDVDRAGRCSERVVRPLGCFFGLGVLAAWCESPEGLRNFRVDHIAGLELLDERFRDEAGKTLADLFRRVEVEIAARGTGTDSS